MKANTAILTLMALTLLAANANADKRGDSEGTWYTGEISEPQYASRFGYGSTDYATNTITSDTRQTCVGRGSIKLETTSGFDTWTYFPNTKDLDLDATDLVMLKFSLRSENKNGWSGDPWVILKDMAGRTVRYDGTSNRLHMALEEWVDYSVPLSLLAERMAAKTKAYLALEEKTRGPAPVLWLVTIEPGFDWKHIACFEIHEDTGGYGFIMWHDGIEFVARNGRPVRWWLSSLEKPDLSVTWAEQFPRYYRYSVDYQNVYPELSAKEQAMKRWPDDGEQIYYEVHVRNVGFARSLPTTFVCEIAGKLCHKQTIPALEPRQETIVKVPWKWKQGGYRFEASVGLEQPMDEISKKNNVLTFQTDAYALLAICEKGMTERVDEVNNAYGSFSYEDWLRGSTVDTMNRLFRHSKYDFAPEGARIGVRVGRIVIVDKIGGEAEAAIEDRLACDGAWSYPTGSVGEYTSLANSFMWALNHELTHQLGIIDDYQFDLPPQNNKINGKGFSQPDGGMMGGGHTGTNTPPAYADIDVAGMNMTYGHRRGYFGEYLFNVPEKNTLVLLLNGKPVAGAEVEVYQKNMDSGLMDGPPVHTGKTDAAGRFVLANRPWWPIRPGASANRPAPPERYTTATGCTLKPNPFGYIDVVGRNGLFLIRVKQDDAWYYAFIDIGHFVCEFARGHRGAASYTLELIRE